jgi:hypothetical protein
MLYAKQQFDPEEPWDGLFRSELLVWVCTLLFFGGIIDYFVCRPTNISLLRPVLLRRKSKRQDQAMLVSMA